MLHFTMGYPAMSVVEPFWWIAATTTLWSWIGYLDGSGISDFKEKAKEKASQFISKKEF
jgi:hypothetical protein